jgi:arylsulfatase
LAAHLGESVGGLLNATFGNATELILALDPTNNADLLMTMNAKLNKLIDSEVGEDVGQMLPGGLEAWRLGGLEAGWVATPAVNDL